MTVYVIGGINQDIVATSDSHPRPGETLTGHDDWVTSLDSITFDDGSLLLGSAGQDAIIRPGV